MSDNVLYCREGDSFHRLPELYNERPDFFKKQALMLVGIYTMENGTMVYSFPKYMKIDLNNVRESDIKQLVTIAKVIEKAPTDDETQYKFDPYQYNTVKKLIDRISLAEIIITDYCQNGLYSEKHSLNGTFSKGKTLWGNTVRKSTPFISEDTPIYDSVRKRAVFEKSESLIVELHKRIVCECYEVVHKLNYTRSVRMPERSNIHGSNLRKYESYILSQLSSVFVQRDIELFKMLAAWCAQSSRNYRTIGCTTNFEDVWEVVNDAVWGNTNKQSNKSTNPVYRLRENSYIGKGDAQPDTIRAISNNGEYHIIIFDSKYYIPRRIEKVTNNNNEECFIIGYPANSDIVKQIAYLREIRSFANSHKNQQAEIQYHNYFLLPACSMFDITTLNSGFFENIGYVTCGEFEGLREILSGWGIAAAEPANNSSEDNRVGVIIVNPEMLYSAFLSGIKISEDDLISLINSENQKKLQTSKLHDSSPDPILPETQTV